MHASLKIKGRVQGVFYRVSTRKKARELGLRGWVRNEVDGGVGVLACGPKDKIELLIEWCRQGPPSARVDDIQIEWQDDDESSHYQDFEIAETV